MKMNNQVKVKVAESFKDSQNEHLVCRGELVLIKSHSQDESTQIFTPHGFLGYKVLIISKTEEIEVGDYYYNTITKKIYESDSIFNDGNNPNTIDIRKFVKKYNNYKILALPENFSQKQLQAIVDLKIKDGDKVFVECELPEKIHIIHDGKGNCKNIDNYQIKLNKSNQIKLFPVKQEYNVKELARIYAKLPKDFDYTEEAYYQQHKIQIYEAFIAGNKQSQKL